MMRAVRTFLRVGIAALCLVPWAVAQTPVTLTGVQGSSYDGIYLSPYYASVDGVATAVVCDDFGDESTVGKSWNATITPFSGISGTNTSWGLAGGTLTQYDAVAYLTLEILQQTPGSSNQIVDTFADWAVFDPSGVASYLSKNPVTSGTLTTAALCTDIFGAAGCSSTWNSTDGGLLATAFGAGAPTGNLEVISPDTSGSTLCKAETGCQAQEFIAEVPEGGAPLAYLLIAGLCCFGAIFLRSRRQIAAPAETA
jgi:hypothetical protein